MQLLRQKYTVQFGRRASTGTADIRPALMSQIILQASQVKATPATRFVCSISLQSPPCAVHQMKHRCIENQINLEPNQSKYMLSTHYHVAGYIVYVYVYTEL